MALVKAVTSFEHNGPHKSGDTFTVSDQHARKLRDAGLVDIVGEDGTAHPEKAAGKSSSVSPAARRSEKPTANESGPGEKPRRKRKSVAQS